MTKFSALLAVAFLLVSGIRAPEPKDISNGICFQGAVLETLQNTVLPSLSAKTSNPFALHAGFAPSSHPFDFLEMLNLQVAAVSSLPIFQRSFFYGNFVLLPPDRPPAVLFS